MDRWIRKIHAKKLSTCYEKQYSQFRGEKNGCVLKTNQEQIARFIFILNRFETNIK